MAPTILSFYHEVRVLEQIMIEMRMTNLSERCGRASPGHTKRALWSSVSEQIPIPIGGRRTQWRGPLFRFQHVSPFLPRSSPGAGHGAGL